MMRKGGLSGYFILATLLLVAGVVIPLLIVSKVLESTFLLNFLAIAASIAGLVLGFIGLAMYVQIKRRQ